MLCQKLAFSPVLNCLSAKDRIWSSFDHRKGSSVLNNFKYSIWVVLRIPACVRIWRLVSSGKAALARSKARSIWPSAQRMSCWGVPSFSFRQLTILTIRAVWCCNAASQRSKTVNWLCWSNCVWAVPRPPSSLKGTTAQFLG